MLGLRLLSRCDGSQKLHLLENSNTSEDVLRKSFRMAAMLLPMFAVVWFLGVLALENPSTLIVPVLFAVANSFLVSQKTFMNVILFNIRVHSRLQNSHRYSPIFRGYQFKIFSIFCIMTVGSSSTCTTSQRP